MAFQIVLLTLVLCAGYASLFGSLKIKNMKTLVELLIWDSIFYFIV